MKNKYDRTSQDVGNILSLEHVNVTVPNQSLATHFYVNGLGFTRDPYIDFGPFNVWINVGDQQFHLPTNDPQVLRGHVGVVVPDLDALVSRLERVSRSLRDTRFAWKRLKARVDVRCPWGNEIRCHAPGAFGDMRLGIPYVKLDVPVGTSSGIAAFYTEVLGAPATASKGECRVNIGGGRQHLIYRETKRPATAYDGHHIAIYIADFSGPHKKLAKRRLVAEESDEHQYRFNWIFDPRTGEKLFELEHEVRSLFHPMYSRNLTNRNPDQTFWTYRQGRDTFVP
jgi:catechol-2,3-dioxygenase